MEALRRVAGVTDYSYGPGGDDLGSSYSRVYLRGFDKGALVMVMVHLLILIIMHL